LVALSERVSNVRAVKLTEHLTAPEREAVEARLRSNLMAWFTTVDATGQPTSVPVWYLLREDEAIVIYSQAGKKKLRNLAANPRVAFGLDVTDIGRSNVRIEGDAHAATDVVAADRNQPYLAKYIERIGALFGTPQEFAAIFKVPLIITPRRLMTGP
jgi:PPOX class probable F420-dependent enzyme